MIWPRLISYVMVLCLISGCSQTNTQKSKQSEHGKRSGQSTVQSKSKTPDLADGPECRVRVPHPMSLADLHHKYHKTFILNGPPNKREVALTFDDAPDAKFTPQVLDVLKKEGVTATFFVLGNRIKAHPDIVARMVTEGHVLGNHSFTHANLPKLTDREFRREITETDRLIRQYTGFTPDIVRPPYGNVKEGQLLWLAKRNKKIVNWNVDSLDWKGLSGEQVATNILAHVHPGAIILQHAAGGVGEDLSGTVDALPIIISKLREDGVRLVSVPDLLDNPSLGR
jgi:peptidoglycan/xylan/chitin deacetylase (PgdA/CDA1 family)